MDIKHIKNDSRGAFVIKQDGERSAELTYVKAGEFKFIIDHTEVDPSLRGQGVGEKLVDAAADYARENNLKIFATCPFAINALRENESYSDVFEG